MTPTSLNWSHDPPGGKMFIPTWGILPPDTAFSLPHKSSGNFSRALVLAWEPVPEWAPARPALVQVKACPAPQLVPAREPVPEWALARPALFAAQVWRQAVAR